RHRVQRARGAEYRVRRSRRPRACRMTAPHLLSWSQVHRGAPIPAIPEMSTSVDKTERTIGDRWPSCPTLTEEDRSAVHELIDELAAEHEARVDEHERRLAAVARRLGERVGRGDATLADARRRLDALVQATDPECMVPVVLVRYAIA